MPMNVKPVPTLDERINDIRMRTAAIVNEWILPNEAKLWGYRRRNEISDHERRESLALREEIKDRPVIGSWTALLDYLQVALAHEPIEQFRVLFLDRKNVLIKDEVQQRGTVDHTPLYPREIVKRAPCPVLVSRLRSRQAGVAA